jgi:hypothetical protein
MRSDSRRSDTSDSQRLQSMSQRSGGRQTGAREKNACILCTGLGASIILRWCEDIVGDELTCDSAHRPALSSFG